jgi:hypothetical protein
MVGILASSGSSPRGALNQGVRLGFPPIGGHFAHEYGLISF